MKTRPREKQYTQVIKAGNYNKKVAQKMQTQNKMIYRIQIK